MDGDGDGFVLCADGQRRWGRFGAAGLLLRAPDADGRPTVLLQHRAPWTHQGGCWGLPGGARDSDETAAETALREADEEAGIESAEVTVRAELAFSPAGDGWSYTTVIADAPRQLPLLAQFESAELSWVPEEEVAGYELHPGFGATWPSLRTMPTTLVVDAANVMGSVPNGWWRDRAGSAERLLDRLAALTPRTVALAEGYSWLASCVAVLEGQASRARDVEGIEVLRAPGSGDDSVVEVSRRGPHHIVVTADRGLRARLPENAQVIGPKTLLGWLDG